MSVLAAAAAPKQATATPIRVMVVDDSVVIRGLIARILEREADIEIVASFGDGKKAVDGLVRSGAEVVVLDIEMPVMDGMTALPLLLQADKSVSVIVASTLTQRNAEISLRALHAGAADYIPKPTSARGLNDSDAFRRALIDKVRALGAARRRAGHPVAASTAIAAPAPANDKPISLRAPSRARPEVLAIGSSTGGPQALFKVLGDLKPHLDRPVAITQHMPPTFTRLLADHITRATGVLTREAQDGDRLVSGEALLAPGGFHMAFERDGADIVARLNEDPPENFCRPSADPMLRSLVRLYGPAVLTTILTGMGNDGLYGGRAVVEAGGTVVAQDKQSSVVWGMPGAVANDGICHAVVPLERIAGEIVKLFKGAAR